MFAADVALAFDDGLHIAPCVARLRLTATVILSSIHASKDLHRIHLSLRDGSGLGDWKTVSM
jgi:hypothetical protein